MKTPEVGRTTFRRGRSTQDAMAKIFETADRAAQGLLRNRNLCTLITLDVKNAFSTASWKGIDDALRDKNTPTYIVRMVRSYLSDRTLQIGNEAERRAVTCGVPQGSVMGPTLWNAIYDGLLRIPTPPGVSLIGFADDLAVVVSARTGQLIESIANPVLQKISDWMRGHGLALAPQKTEALMLTRKWAYVKPRLNVEGFEVPVVKCTKYLGVYINSGRRFTTHVQKMSTRATETSTALSRLMPNTGGPCQGRRKLLMSITTSILSHAAAIWGTEAMETVKNQAGLIRPQRQSALRIIRAYRTVSDEAALFLAGTPPIDIVVREARNTRLKLLRRPQGGDTRNIKIEEREAIFTTWQRQWDKETTKARWTRRLLPNVRRWVDRCGGQELTFHLTQILTGHGCFNFYLNRIGKLPDRSCGYCGHSEDTAEHTVFECPWWEHTRRPLTSLMGRRARPEDVEDILCGPQVTQIPDNHNERAASICRVEERRQAFTNGGGNNENERKRQALGN